MRNFGIFAALLLSAGSAQATSFVEQESNDTFETANVLVHDGSILVSGFREFAPQSYTNRDYFRFAATAGDHLSIHYDAIQYGDPYLLLHDGTGLEVARNDDSFNSANSFIAYTVNTTGNYFLDLTGYSGSSLWNYTLSVTGLTPDIRPGPSGVPEPSTWVTIIAGFGAVGAMARRSRQRVIPA